jgi:hypothetical protein
MKPAEMKRLGRLIFSSQRGWQTRLAEMLGMDGSAIRRNLSGATPISGPVAVAIRLAAARVQSSKRP